MNARKQWPHDVISILVDKLPLGVRFETFVETGTLFGATTIHEAAHFRQVHTVELSKELYAANVPRFAPHHNVHAYQGRSVDRLPEIIALVETDCLFYLDAHWSGDATVDWVNSNWKGYGVDTAHLGDGSKPTGEEQCPLLEELRIINERFYGVSIVLIDDLRVVGNKDAAFRGEDWTHISVEKIDACFDEKRVLDRRVLNLKGQNAQYVILLDRR